MLFTFPSRYWFAIGLSGVFSLTGWSRRIRAEFLVLRVTQDTTRSCVASVTGLSPSTDQLSRRFSSRFKYHNVVLLPRICIATHAVWALPRSLATTGGIISLFSLPAGTKMFQFPAFASLPCGKDSSPSGCWVVPFGDSWIKGHLHLPMTYRSLSRPSSPPRAKASTRRPNFLSPFTLQYINNVEVAHTISCNLRVITQFLKTKSFITYSLVCQYVKDLSSVSNYR